MKKLLAALLLAVFSLSLLPSAMAAVVAPRVIRVGYLEDCTQFISMNEAGEMQGYAVEYLKEIEKNSSLRFVYLLGTWQEHMQAIQNRDLDLLCHVSLTAEGMQQFDYSQQIFGSAQSLLYTSPSYADIYYEDFAALDKHSIGFLEGSMSYALFTQYALQHDFSFIPRFYPSNRAMREALQAGQVLAFANEHMVDNTDLKVIANFDSRPVYMVSYLGNDFMQDIDRAMTAILQEDSTYNSKLFEQYYGKNPSTKDPHFTQAEMEYVAELLQNRETINGFAGLKIPIHNDVNPMSYIKDGHLTGIRVELLNQVSKISGIPFRYVSIQSNRDKYDYAYFREQGFDLFLVEDNPVNRSDAALPASGMCLSKPIDNFKKCIVAQKGMEITTSKAYTIAHMVGSNSLPQLLKEWYPNATTRSYRSIDDCLYAVVSGEVDLFIYNQYFLEKELLRPQYKSLAVVPGVFFPDHYSLSPIIFQFGSYTDLKEGAIDPMLNDPRLISILNKSISYIDAEVFKQIVIQHTIGTYSTELSAEDFFYQYKLSIIIIAAALCSIILLIAILYFMKRKSFLALDSINHKLADSVAQAESANEAKSLFLSRMSHEIRTPMNAIVGITAIAQKHLHEPDNMQDYLHKIDTSSKVLLNIINDVLDMSAIESKKLRLAHSDFDIKAVLNNISDIYYTQCRQKGIHFEMSVDIQHEILKGDSLRLSQILLNLISNAYKFTEKGGEIRVEVTEQTRREQRVFLRFQVSDTGVGMNEDMQARLFKPFEQASGETAKKYGGSGLGLSITKNLIDMMQGAIEVKSALGEGTSFQVDLSFACTGEQRVENYHKLKNVRAMVIDDDGNAREYTAIVLDRLGISYDIATSGEDALQKMHLAQSQGHSYDICLVDWKMPDMDGLEVIRNIRKSFDSDTIIIIVSAYDLSEVKEEAEEAGANIFVTKPLFQSTVFNVLMAMTGEKCVNTMPAEEDLDFHGARVLLAEDNALNSEIAVDILEMVNVTVDVAENGEEAVKLFEASETDRYFAILMDIQMPLMDGHEASRAIRASQHPQARQIPIFAMTANAFTEDISASLSSGMNGHISKPIDTNALYKTLYEAYEEK